ncbi:hypothetical protein Cni_G16914 [Canna indica]|uniref:Uncharacterized protein n=1 Tax=Canna indica TaxID=4628 RepID=A0AAQ3KLL3_9LILI|nr:hypothetical protein Cni_G16914 [Canna indica]
MTSNGQNKVFPDSSPPPSPSSSPPPDLKTPPATSHRDADMAIHVGSDPAVPDKPPKDESTKHGGTPLPAAPVAKDFKRVSKMAYTATLGIVAISVTLLMSLPHPVDPDRLTLYACDATFACLSLILSIGLIYYSIVSPVGEKLAWVQEKVMVFYCLLVVLSVISRMAVMFPLVHFLVMLLAIVVVIGFLVLCLCLAWKAEKKAQ